MADLIASGLAWLAQQQRGSGSQSGQVCQQVTYTRGPTTATVNATLEQTAFRMDDLVTRKSKLEHSDTDFVFTIADLEARGITMPPQQGDSIAYGGDTYVLMHIPNERPWKMDAYGIAVRVHTKRST